MDEDKKENFKMEIVKKRLSFRSDSICRVEVYLPLMFRTCAVKTVKSCISLFLLPANLCFQVVTVLVKTPLLLHISYTLETFHKSSITRFLCVKFLKNTSKFLKVIDASVAEMWSFMAFHGGFLIIALKLMKRQTALFQDCSFKCPSVLLPNLLFIS